MEIGFAKDIAIVIGGIVALFTFINGVLEYMRQGAQRRVEQFVEIRRRLKENSEFKEITSLLNEDSQKLTEIPSQNKRDYLGLLEEVALMNNSRLIRKNVAQYMFGSYAVKCWDSNYFWNNVRKDDIYWSLFNDFAQQMKVEEHKFKFNRKKMRF